MQILALLKMLKDCTYRNVIVIFKQNFFYLLDCINPTKYHFRPSRLSHKLITSLVQTIEHSTARLSDWLQQWWTMCEGEGRCEEVFSWPPHLKGGSWVWLLVSTLSLCCAACCGKLINLLNASLCHLSVQQCIVVFFWSLCHTTYLDVWCVWMVIQFLYFWMVI